MISMSGIIVTLFSSDEKPTRSYGTAYGVVFPDNQVYVHEPLCDTFGSLDDLKAQYPNHEIMTTDGIKLS